MKIAEVGNVFASTIKVTYLSDQTFMDFDFLILDTDYIEKTTANIEGKALIQKKEKLLEFIKHKKTPLIMFAPESDNRQLKVENNFIYVPINDFVPTEPFTIKKQTGQKIEVIPNTPFSKFLMKYMSLFRYTSYFSTHTGKITLEVPYIKNVLGFYNDNVVFLPRLIDNFKQHENSFLADLTSLLAEIRAEKSSEVALPKWAENYLLPTEDGINKNINSLSEEIIKLGLQLEQAKLELLNIGRKKSLFTSTGSPLENEVKNIFEDLGFEILESGIGRDDLIIKYQEKTAVVEIKGVTGSSAEKHAAQLEKWVSIYHEKNDTLPKGILLVNSNRDQELKNRKNDSFPHQMLNYSEKRGHCLITGLQLLCLYLEIQKDPTKKDELINSLFDSIGIYKGFDNWRDYIQQVNES